MKFLSGLMTPNVRPLRGNPDNAKRSSAQRANYALMHNLSLCYYQNDFLMRK